MFGWFKKTPVVPAMPVIYPLEKIEANIRRFQRALDQTTKGGDKIYDLNKNLAYWETMRDLVRLAD